VASTTSRQTADLLKREWKKLWQEKFEDKFRAEGIASRDFSALFVEKGTVIIAARDFKPLSFQEILERYRFSDISQFIPTDPSVGGWKKFVQKNITSQRPHGRRERANSSTERHEDRQQLKKSGHGWLHK
jgi:hypothetical protein